MWVARCILRLSDYSVRREVLLFDHLIRPPQQRLRDREPEGLRGLEVDDQLELGAARSPRTRSRHCGLGIPICSRMDVREALSLIGHEGDPTVPDDRDRRQNVLRLHLLLSHRDAALLHNNAVCLR